MVVNEKFEIRGHITVKETARDLCERFLSIFDQMAHEKHPMNSYLTITYEGPIRHKDESLVHASD
jgi:hypothetical protein